MVKAEASPDIELVRQFINTYEAEAGEERLSTPAALAAWLRERSLLPAGAAPAVRDVERAREVREAVRDLLWARQRGAAPAPESVAALNRALGRVRVRVAFDEDGQAALGLDGSPVDVALASILEALRRGQERGEAERLKVCRSETCRWAYYDASKNRSRTWCEMATCGSRTKARAYRERKRVAAGRRME